MKQLWSLTSSAVTTALLWAIVGRLGSGDWLGLTILIWAIINTAFIGVGFLALIGLGALAVSRDQK
jgi:hypothetical protein